MRASSMQQAHLQYQEVEEADRQNAILCMQNLANCQCSLWLFGHDNRQAPIVHSAKKTQRRMTGGHEVLIIRAFLSGQEVLVESRPCSTKTFITISP
jgi:hypothetical protein